MIRNVLEKVAVGVVGGLVTSIAIWLFAQTGTFIRTILTPELAGSAIVAFEGECPPDWRPYEKAGGRFIVSVGRNRDKNGDERSFVAGLGTDEGEYLHTLLEAEMPSHTHEFSGQQTKLGSWGLPFIRDKIAVSGVAADLGYFRPEGKISPAGQDAPHNNMPPYFAMQFCTKK